MAALQRDSENIGSLSRERQSARIRAVFAVVQRHGPLTLHLRRKPVATRAPPVSKFVARLRLYVDDQ